MDHLGWYLFGVQTDGSVEVTFKIVYDEKSVWNIIDTFYVMLDWLSTPWQTQGLNEWRCLNN